MCVCVLDRVVNKPMDCNLLLVVVVVVVVGGGGGQKPASKWQIYVQDRVAVGLEQSLA